MATNSKNYLKFAIAVVACLLARLIPFRMPNVEPLMATVMPFSKAYGIFFSLFFAVLSILSYDLITNTLGVQTFFVLFAYIVVSLWSTQYFKNREANISNFVKFSIMGTLFFDAMTGLTVGPLFFHQSFAGSFIGQIPFTLYHLLGNIIFATILSPAIYSLLVKKKAMRENTIINVPHLKTI
ncbi:MAG: hypothetical protein Q7K54_04145 [Candidatus Parcubacteria bacterium]|nr:hypothetical protein [Candidatus Parcubacteria bacterium]